LCRASQLNAEPSGLVKGQSIVPISIELVPRSRAAIASDIDVLRREFPEIGMVNIPDLLRFDLRSWDACAIARGSLARAIPHVRAMDFSLKAATRLAALLGEQGLSEALIVRGDPPQDLARPVHATTSAELIAALKQVAPSIRLYASFDPYRQGLRAAVDSAHEKIEAGASGLFTQPFFDLRLLQVCSDLLPRTEIFWGVSPVLSAASRRYWEVKNHAVFPSRFEPTLGWNRDFAAQCLEWARETEASLYFMPIRVGLSEYLGGLL
jgi:methylenetetrahydrofolate reductase (NADPH)